MSERPLFIAPDPEPEPDPESLPIPQADPQQDPVARLDEGRMSLIEHLDELRRVLIVSLICWLVGSIVGLAASGWIIDLLVQPLKTLKTPLHYFSPMGYFTIHLKVGLVVGLVIALPAIAHQIWTFVSPGLRPVERRFAGPLLFSAIALFAAGGALAYFFLYIAVRIIGAVSSDQSLVFFPEAGAYIGFVVILMLAFGLTFEFPVALVLGAMIGFVRSSWLRSHRRHAVLVLSAVGYVVTPGVDPVTPLALIIPLLVLFEGSIRVIRMMGK
jgi:sec-independent protein translocase protein TatC